MPVAGAVIGAVGSLGGSAMQARGAGQAADAATQGQREANQIQWNMFKTSRDDQLPWLQTGSNALAMMSALLNLPGAGASQYGRTPNYTPPESNGGSSHFDVFNPLGLHERDGPGGALTLDPLGLFRHHGGHDNNEPPPPLFTPDTGNEPPPAGTPGTTPPGTTPPGGVTPLSAQEAFQKYQDSTGYQFRLGQGLQATERSAAARGGLNSGATLKALERYGQNIGSAEFGNYLGQLGTLAGFGQSTARDVGQQGIQTGSMMGNNAMNAANARGTAYQNQGNAWGQGINQLGGLAGYYFGGQNQQPQQTQQTQPWNNWQGSSWGGMSWGNGGNGGSGY